MCPGWVFAAFFVHCRADPASQPLAVASAVAAWVERLLKAAPRSDASRNLLQRFFGVPEGHVSPGRARGGLQAVGLWGQVVGLRCRGCACVGWGSYSRPPSRPWAGRRGKSWGKILKKPEIGFKT